MEFCPKCKENHSIFYNFCPECGSWLRKRQDIKCPDCGDLVLGVYCVNCGEWVGEELLKKLKYKVDRKKTYS